MHSFRLAGWQESVLKEFRKLYDQRETALALLVCEGDVIKAHPRILYANSTLAREIIQEQGSRQPFTLAVGFCKTQELIRALQVLYGYTVTVSTPTEASLLRSALEEIGVHYWESC